MSSSLYAGYRPHELSAMHNRAVVEEHASEAAFLWTLRERAVRAPHYRLKHLAMLEARLLAHLEGLRTAGAHGLAHARRALADAEPGGVFVVTVLAFASQDATAMRQVLQLGLSQPPFARALVAGLAWLDPAMLRSPLARLIDSPHPQHRRIALAVQTAHRLDSGALLQQATHDPDPGLRSTALRSIGELKRFDLMTALDDGRADPDPGCRFWAAWSSVLLGRAESAPAALQAATNDPSLTAIAIDIAMRGGDSDWAHRTVRAWAAQSGTLRHAVIAAGALGDPAAIPWLLQLAEHPPVARAAGEAFCMITGADADQSELKQDEPPDAGDGHEDDSDLRWPHPDGFSAWWRTERGRFTEQQRYLCGRIVSETAAIDILHRGYQRQRRGAAIELARLRADAMLFPAASRADWQQRRLAA